MKPHHFKLKLENRIQKSPDEQEAKVLQGLPADAAETSPEERGIDGKGFQACKFLGKWSFLARGEL